MPRISKEPDERKSEIIDAAQKLFEDIGYEETSVNDIIRNVGIAKGTFYYYFKSKEEILDAVINRQIEIQIQYFMKIIGDNDSNAVMKLEKIIRANVKINSEQVGLLEYLHKKENIVMHQKTLVQIVKKFAPVLAIVIKQGIDEKLFNINHPLEVSEFLLIGMNFMFDLSIFSWSKEEYAKRIEALAEIMENTLKAEKGRLSFFNVLKSEMLGI